MINYNKKTIMPFVVLYRDVFKNCEEILDTLKNSESSKILSPWEPWYELGERTRLEFVDTKDLNEKEEYHLSIQENIYSSLMKVYKDYISDWTTQDVIEKYVNPNDNFWTDWKYVFGDFVDNWEGFDNVPDNTKPDSWIKSPVEILKHDHTVGRNLPLAIGYHLDAFNSKDAAGPKSIITGTLYLNDDYEGGEISFLNEFDSSIITYKPKQGDVIVFPSAKPFFHAAQKVYNSDKYLVRNFLLWEHSGSDRYKEGEAKFGKDQWRLMQDYIREAEDTLGFYQKDVYMPGVPLHNKMAGNGIPFFPKTVEVWEW